MLAVNTSPKSTAPPSSVATVPPNSSANTPDFNRAAACNVTEVEQALQQLAVILAKVSQSLLLFHLRSALLWDSQLTPWGQLKMSGTEEGGDGDRDTSSDA